MLTISGLWLNLNVQKIWGEQFFFINQRFIRSPYLNHAVNAAFEGLLKVRTRHFLNLTVDPQTVILIFILPKQK